METETLKNRLLEVILLLIGLQVFYFATGPLITFMVSDYSENLMLVLKYNSWVGRTIFGAIILSQIMKHRRKIAFPVAILTVLHPVVGCVFYLITTTTIFDKIEQWFIDLLD